MKKVILFLFSLVAYKSFGQTKCWSVLVLKKEKNLEVRDDMTTFDEHGFYLYRNCVYDFKLSKKKYNARLLDIKKDSLVFTTHFNSHVAERLGHVYDTLTVHHKSITQLSLITDRIMGIYSVVLLKNYEMVFQQDSTHCELPVDTVQLYEGDFFRVPIVPFLTDQGLNWLYEQDGRTYYYMGKIPKPMINNTVYKKKAIGFIPMEREIDEINGLALAFLAMTDGPEDSLKIHGVCLEVFPLAWFAPMFGSFLSRDSDVFSSRADPTTMKISGFYLSLGGALAEAEIAGAYIGGAATMVNKLEGLSITGIHTITQECNGVCISGLRNQTKKGKGLQIALFNSSQNLKGVQLGLWNKNQKRSLPFINWNFN